MSPREETARLLFRRGEFVALLAEYSDVASEKSHSSADIRLTVAHAAAITGDLAAARRLASSRLGRSASTEELARSELVLGIASERVGDITIAQEHYERGITTLGPGSGGALEAWLRLHRFRLALERDSKESLKATLLALRRLVVRVADPQVTAYLHMCVSVLEGSTGRIDEALRHSQLAASLLESADSNALRSANLVNLGCLATLRGRLPEAATHFTQAESLVRSTGDPFIAARVAGNLAHLRLLSGNIAEARTLFEETILRGRFGKQGEIAALDGLARVHLAAGRLDQCLEALRSIEDYQSRHGVLSSSYNVRWSNLTKARLLLRSRKYSAADTLLLDLRSENAHISDTPFEVSLALLRALVNERLGLHERAAAEIIQSEAGRRNGVDELAPQAYRIAGLVLTTLDPILSRVLLARADRVWETQGVVSIRVELDDDGIDVDTARRELAAARSTDPPAPTTGPSVADSIAAAFDLADHPQLLGTELLALIRGLDCSPGASLTEVRGEVPPSTPAHTVLSLGAAGESTVVLRCPLPSDPARAVVLADVLRLAGAALELERARRAERARGALWPAGPAEEHAGGVFVAEEMQELLAMVRRIAPTTLAVLITGPMGRGSNVWPNRHTDRRPVARMRRALRPEGRSDRLRKSA